MGGGGEGGCCASLLCEQNCRRGTNFDPTQRKRTDLSPLPAISSQKRRPAGDKNNTSLLFRLLPTPTVSGKSPRRDSIRWPCNVSAAAWDTSGWSPRGEALWETSSIRLGLSDTPHTRATRHWRRLGRRGRTLASRGESHTGTKEVVYKDKTHTELPSFRSWLHPCVERLMCVVSRGQEKGKKWHTWWRKKEITPAFTKGQQMAKHPTLG